MKTAETVPATVELAKAGQSPWLDSISRQLIRSGELKSLVQKSGVLGVTSNPTIFEQAIGKHAGGYEPEIRSLVRQERSTLEIYDALTIADIREACDVLKAVHAESQGEHGYVSLEVRPDLAHDRKRTVEEALKLVKAVGKPNLMVKVPATPEGIEAFRELTALGVHVNVTLIFSAIHYRSVLEAYIQGLEARRARKQDLSKVHSVASVFVSRFDSAIDGQLSRLQEMESEQDERADLESLKGKAALANCKAIYQDFKKTISSKRFRDLAAAGAAVQKVLWASTGVKNPKYADLLYVESLVGRDTVNTMPRATLDALLDHGRITADTAEQNADEAAETIEHLKEWGIDIDEVGQKLQHDGLIAFENSFDSLMRTLEIARGKNARGASAKYQVGVSKSQAALVPVQMLEKDRWIERFFNWDTSLWKEEEEHKKVILNRLGWLKSPDWMLGRLYELDELQAQVKSEKIKDIVLLGMGGSSLAPEVINFICRKSKTPRFHVLDTTDPASILSVLAKIALKSTLFVVSSKSGSTVETMSQFQFFYDRVLKLYGRKADKVSCAGRHFIAVTDEGSRLEHEGHSKEFRKVFINPGNIGGRYSALSLFGLVPAAMLGIPVRKILDNARSLLEFSSSQKKVRENASFYMGALLGGFAKNGIDKLTILPTKSLASFGAWLEQLIAESTGKEGRGVVPVDGEAPGSPSVYGQDRFFVVLRQKGDKDKRLEKRVKALKKAGFPVVESVWSDPSVIGAEFLSWEIITAVSSAVLGVNPFDEPNVKESKDNTTRILAAAEKEGEIPKLVPVTPVRSGVDFEGFFSSLREEKPYIAFLAYIDRNPLTLKALARIQARMRDGVRLPVLVGFGPRYLHSIGQLYKGGPSKGAFIVLLNQDAKDASIPHAKFSFSQLKMAQGIGDAQAASVRERPLLTVDLGKDVLKGLTQFEKSLEAYLKTMGR